MKIIDDFHGENFFLDNFYPVSVQWRGTVYPSSEHAFQAAKCKHPADRLKFTALSAGYAKAFGNRIPLRQDWENIKLGIMTEIVHLKFNQNPELIEKLLDTGGALLVEGNTWNDTFWGVCKGTGQNHLGKILMYLRDYYKEAKYRV